MKEFTPIVRSNIKLEEIDTLDELIEYVDHLKKEIINPNVGVAQRNRKRIIDWTEKSVASLDERINALEQWRVWQNEEEIKMLHRMRELETELYRVRDFAEALEIDESAQLEMRIDANTQILCEDAGRLKRLETAVAGLTMGHQAVVEAHNEIMPEHLRRIDALEERLEDVEDESAKTKADLEAQFVLLLNRLNDLEKRMEEVAKDAKTYTPPTRCK